MNDLNSVYFVGTVTKVKHKNGLMLFTLRNNQYKYNDDTKNYDKQELLVDCFAEIEKPCFKKNQRVGINGKLVHGMIIKALTVHNLTE